MTGMFYVATLIYAILAVLTATFLICIGPSLVVEAIDLLSNVPLFLKHTLHPDNNELVERLLLGIEEVREWRKVPGRHRSVTHGVHSPEDTFFINLIVKLRAEEKELANA
jgi:hypothetical protein